MNLLFYGAAIVALLATAMVITRKAPIHALLYLVVSLLALAVAFFAIGASFAAALEVIIYAGAIVVLFVFVVMMLNLGPQAADQEARWLEGRMFIGPGILALLLFLEMAFCLGQTGAGPAAAREIGPRAVGALLFGADLLAVEITGLLLLAGLVGAFHLGREVRDDEGRRP